MNNSITATHTTLKVIDHRTWTIKRWMVWMILLVMLGSVGLTTLVIIANTDLRADLFRASQKEYNFKVLEARTSRFQTYIERGCK